MKLWARPRFPPHVVPCVVLTVAILVVHLSGVTCASPFQLDFTTLAEDQDVWPVVGEVVEAALVGYDGKNSRIVMEVHNVPRSTGESTGKALFKRLPQPVNSYMITNAEAALSPCMWRTLDRDEEGNVYGRSQAILLGRKCGLSGAALLTMWAGFSRSMGLAYDLGSDRAMKKCSDAADIKGEFAFSALTYLKDGKNYYEPKGFEVAFSRNQKRVNVFDLQEYRACLPVVKAIHTEPLRKFIRGAKEGITVGETMAHFFDRRRTQQGCDVLLALIKTFSDEWGMTSPPDVKVLPSTPAIHNVRRCMIVVLGSWRNEMVRRYIPGGRVPGWLVVPNEE